MVVGLAIAGLICMSSNALREGLKKVAGVIVLRGSFEIGSQITSHGIDKVKEFISTKWGDSSNSGEGSGGGSNDNSNTDSNSDDKSDKNSDDKSKTGEQSSSNSVNDSSSNSNNSTK